MSTKAQAAKAKKYQDQLERGNIKYKTRAYNRCEYSGRARGYVRFFGMSRIKFREMARKGMLPGVRKSSW